MRWGEAFAKGSQEIARQLSLFDLEISASTVPPTIEPVQAQTTQPAQLCTSCRPGKNMDLNEMISIRTWLWEWGKANGYPEVSFQIGNGAMGDFRSGIILAGQVHWSHVLRYEDMEWVIKAVEWIQR